MCVCLVCHVYVTKRDIFRHADISELDEGINPNPFPHERYGQVDHIGSTWGSSSPSQEVRNVIQSQECSWKKFQKNFLPKNYFFIFLFLTYFFIIFFSSKVIFFKKKIGWRGYIDGVDSRRLGYNLIRGLSLRWSCVPSQKHKEICVPSFNLIGVSKLFFYCILAVLTVWQLIKVVTQI